MHSFPCSRLRIFSYQSLWRLMVATSPSITRIQLSYFHQASSRKNRFGATESKTCPMPLVSASCHEPYSYTSGRWLVREELELRARHIHFDFNALCQRVVQVCTGARSIKSYQKREGGFNRAFLFILDNDEKIVAKLPFSFAGPCSLTTNSEVATIKYLQLKTSIPVPSIIDWNDDPCNAIGSEYIIMEHANGVPLHEQWPSISGDDRIRLIENISRLSGAMAELEFPAYGSLYLQSDHVDTAPLIPFDDGFFIGPHCAPMFWKHSMERTGFDRNLMPNHGPWLDLAAYCDGLVDAGIFELPSADAKNKSLPRYHGSVSDHRQLLECGREVIKQMVQDSRVQSAANPTLFHADLHKRNIFVSEKDPATVTNLIDWQATSIEPAFWYVDETPDFARSRSDDTDGIDWLCTQAYEACLQHNVTRLARPRSMDEAFFRPFRYCHRTWKDGAVVLRHELIETARCWERLGLPGVCPFSQPSLEDLATHQREYRLFEAAQNLRYDLARLIDVATDGWVPISDWARANEAHCDIYDGMLQAVLNNKDPDADEPVRTEADLQEIWPFDLEIVSRRVERCDVG